MKEEVRTDMYYSKMTTLCYMLSALREYHIRNNLLSLISCFHWCFKYFQGHIFCLHLPPGIQRLDKKKGSHCQTSLNHYYFHETIHIYPYIWLYLKIYMDTRIYLKTSLQTLISLNIQMPFLKAQKRGYQQFEIHFSQT